MKLSNDWEHALETAQPPFANRIRSGDIASVVVMATGEPDGESWLAVFELKNHDFISIRSFCDLTGWSGESWGRRTKATNMSDLIFSLTDKERERLGL